jgi:hypothetical protein
MPFPDIEELIRQGRFGAAEELIFAFSADAEGEGLLELAERLSDLAGEYGRLGRVEDAVRARDRLSALEAEGAELALSRADVSVINAWLDSGCCPEAAEIFKGMAGPALDGGPLPEGELQRLALVALANILGALADERDLAGAEGLFPVFRGKSWDPANSDLAALSALNAVILYVHAGRMEEAGRIAREMEGYGDDEVTRSYSARARKIVSDLGSG